MFKFAPHRPHQVVSMSLRDREVCTYKYHENIKFLFDGRGGVFLVFPRQQKMY